jgi:predicted nucleic acid-binding protein
LTLVVDASVVMKWYVHEPARDRALGLVGTDLAAPDMLLAEVANATAKKVRRGEMDAEQAALVLPQVRKAVVLLPSGSLAEAVLATAMDLRHPAYDCFFLIAAEHLDAALVTADERLIKSCRGSRFEERVRLL